MTMDYKEAREWLAGNCSMANIVPREPFETWQERIARADAAMMEQAYWVHSLREITMTQEEANNSLRKQNDRLREKNDRLRAENERLRAENVKMRKLLDRIETSAMGSKQIKDHIRAYMPATAPRSADTVQKEQRERERFNIRMIPDNSWLSAFSLERGGRGCHIEVVAEKRAGAALTFSLQEADYVSALLEHFGYTCQVTKCEDADTAQKDTP